MSTAPDAPESDEAARWSPWAIAAAVVLALLFGAIALVGIRGCFSLDPQEAARLEAERKKKEEADKKKQEPVRVDPPVVQPSEAKSPAQYVKPGHWATATQRMRANYRDFVGEMQATVVDNQNVPYPVNRTPFVLRSVRPVALSKGQPKNIESTFFVPQVDRTIRYQPELVERGLGLTIAPGWKQLSRMPAYQYHFVILAKEPSRYGFVKTLDSVHVPYSGESEFDAREDTLHYRVDALDVGQSIPLSDNPLTWTSIAYVLWDEMDPQLFTPAQEKSLVDWLHWGGQLIISGPDSLDLLKGSFLEKYLPARNAGPRTIAAGDVSIADLNDGWMISTRDVPGEPLRPTVPWSAIKLEIVPGGEALPNTGELLVERPVGRGRIVVSAMQLAERELINWRSGFESLFNACVLRRPPRVYREGSAGGPTLLWDITRDPTLVDRRLDARLTTRLSYFARDLGVETAYKFQEVRDEFAQANQFNQFGQPQVVREYRPPEDPGGLGAWNDFCATANEARTALREAAGVEVPDASFVIVCLVAYLTVLVPLNWLLFHALGRVEWAWVAAPVIAVAGTFIVVHRARLDIGFVRAHTEIGILEQQPDYPRALLSRYTALYTSLSTTYDLEFDNLTTVAAPFPRDKNDSMLSGQRHMLLGFQRHDNVRLTGLPVSSASTNFVRSEQMFALNGPIRVSKSVATGAGQAVNNSQFTLDSVAVVRRPTGEEEKLGRKLEGRFIGQLLPGQSAPLPSRLPSVAKPEAPFAEERATEEQLQRRTRLNLEPMFRLALSATSLEPGEMRLVARIDDVLPGQTITPAASQIRGATLVVAHLQYAPLELPRRDANTRMDIKAAEQAELNLE